MAGLRRWSVVFLILALFLLYHREIPLTGDERGHLISTYQETHHVYQLQAHYYSRNQIKISMLATPLSGGPAQRINLLYDRERQLVLAAEMEPYGTPLGEWLVNFAIVFTFIAFWLLYLDPLLEGRYCPTCRWLGIFPRILKEKERTLYPAVLGDDGDQTPEIIEKEWACPTCTHREFRVREQSVVLSNNLLTELKGNMNLYQSTEENQREVEAFEERVKTTGITRKQHLERLEATKAAADAKTTPRT